MTQIHLTAKLSLHFTCPFSTFKTVKCLSTGQEHSRTPGGGRGRVRALGYQESFFVYCLTEWILSLTQILFDQKHCGIIKGADELLRP